MLRLGVKRLSFWDTPYNTPGKARVLAKRMGLTYAWALFMAPTCLCLIGTYPQFLLAFADYWRPMEFPPQSDPQIIADIFYGRKPEHSSNESYAKEWKKANDVMASTPQ
jgi:hypothetical protein